MLQLAAQALRDALSGRAVPPPDLTTLPPDLQSFAGVFVTLRKQHDLRGCVGTIDPRSPLALEVMETAIASAADDPRFTPVTGDELEDMTIEISVLSPFRRLARVEEIVPGKDGVYVKAGRARGLFLPQVWTESGWDRDRFLQELCRHKMGVDPDVLKEPDTEIYAFEVDQFEQPLKRLRPASS